MNGFERRKQAKMQTILEAAEALFTQDGISATPIAHIARQAGVSQVSIYNYFENKQGLVLAVIRQIVQRYTAIADDILTSDLPFLEKLIRLFDMKKQELLSYNPDFFSALFHQNQEVYQYLLQVCEQESLPRLRQLVAMGKAEGVISPALSDEAVMLYTRVILQAYEQMQGDISPALWGDMLSLFVFGLDGCRPLPGAPLPHPTAGPAPAAE